MKSVYYLQSLQKDDDRASKANELSLANVGGVFVVLLAGMGLACLIAVFEFIWKSRCQCCKTFYGRKLRLFTIS